MNRLKRMLTIVCASTLVAATTVAQSPGTARTSKQATGGLPLPEPMTLALVALGVGGASMAFARHRRERKHDQNSK